MFYNYHNSFMDFKENETDLDGTLGTSTIQIN